MKEISRGQYQEIRKNTLNPKTRKQVWNLVDSASMADHVDEHGAWEFGCEFDGKHRGYSINWDVYGIGRDFFTRRTLAVIQIRKWEKRTKNGFPNIRKSYFLLGRNEDNSVFAHPVESRVIHAAIRAGKDVILATQKWIFGCDYQKIIRQGDLALIPVRRIPQDKIETSEMVLEQSHCLRADDFRENGNLYAKNPNIVHAVHPEVTGEGWFRVIVGKRSNFWNFAAPTID